MFTKCALVLCACTVTFVELYLDPDNAYPGRPDMEAVILKGKGDMLLDSMLGWTDRKKATMQMKTVNQTGSKLWQKIRRQLLSAAYFGDVCNWKVNTSTAKLVDRVLYEDPYKESVPTTTWTRRRIFLQLIANGYTTLRPVGMFVDRLEPYLMACPDGMVRNDTAIIIKWLHLPEYGTRTVKNITLDCDHPISTLFQIRYGELTSYVNTSHNYYYEMQGILHIVEVEYGIIFIVGPVDFQIVGVARDRRFFDQKMIGKLKYFYKRCLLPELIDGRRKRKMPLRDILMQEYDDEFKF